MNCTSIISNHIVLNTNPDVSVPSFGIILIANEIISDIILFGNSTSIQEVSELYKKWNPVDLSDFYISPGIVDLNIRIEWESFEELTKSAISGGVTFALVEDGYYNDAPQTGELYCDIAKMASLKQATKEYVNLIDSQPYFAMKLYMYPPHMSIQGLADNLDPVLEELEKTSMKVIIDPTLPDPRMLHCVSPFRLRNLTDRLDENCAEKLNFSGGFPELIEQDVFDEDDTPEVEKLEKTSEIFPEKEEFKLEQVNPKINVVGLITTDANVENKSEPPKAKLKIPNFEEKLLTSQVAKARRAKRGTTQVVDDLDRRIITSQMLIQNLSIAEYETYNSSGITNYVQCEKSPEKTISSRDSFCSNSNSSVISSSPSPSLFQRRKMSGSFTLLCTASVSPKEVLYNFHMSGYSHSWELSGLTELFNSLKKSTLKVHISNISSAAAFNKIRKEKNLLSQVTCELPANHLYFNSLTIPNYDTRFKSAPPYRNNTNTLLLLDLLKANAINAISSNHTCIHPQFKNTNLSFTRAVDGMPSVENALQTAWSSILSIKTRFFEKEQAIVQLANLFSKKPAEILGVDRQRGSIEKGKFADFIVWKPYETYTVGAGYSPFPEMSPFLGKEVQGKIEKVYLRGKLVFNLGVLRATGKVVNRN